MISEYEIHSDTLAIIPVDSNSSKVIERDKIIFIKKNTTEIIDDSCKYFGSSFNGRHEGTKNMIGVNYKSPILIEETRNLIFFPTTSPRYKNCYWISLNNIKNYEKLNNYSKIIFNNELELSINISYGSLQNQILRATLLESVLHKRINI